MSTPAERQYNWQDDAANGIDITDSRMDNEFDAIITKLNQKAIIQASAPSSPIAGMLWYDSTNNLLKQYRNGEWVTNGIVHVSDTAPTTTQTGDVWIDTSGSEIVINARNLANDGWIDLSNPFTAGMIIMWSGAIANIPTGWVLCDGTNSTPDLRDKFIVGATQDDSGVAKSNITGSLLQSGGASTVILTKGNIPAHVHGIHNSAGGGGGGGDLTNLQKTDNTNLGGINTDDGTAGGLKTSPDAVTIIPVFYALAFIMKS